MIRGQHRFGVGGKTQAVPPIQYATWQGYNTHYSHTFDQITGGEEEYILIEPKTRCEIRIQPDSDGQINYALYENADASGGDYIDPSNFNRLIEDTPDIADVVYSPDVADTGEQLVDLELSGSADGPGSSQSPVPSTIAPRGVAWIVDETKPLLIEVTPDSGDYVSIKINCSKYVNAIE